MFSEILDQLERLFSMQIIIVLTKLPHCFGHKSHTNVSIQMVVMHLLCQGQHASLCVFFLAELKHRIWYAFKFIFAKFFFAISHHRVNLNRKWNWERFPGIQELSTAISKAWTADQQKPKKKTSNRKKTSQAKTSANWKTNKVFSIEIHTESVKANILRSQFPAVERRIVANLISIVV